MVHLTFCGSKAKLLSLFESYVCCFSDLCTEDQICFSIGLSQLLLTHYLILFKALNHLFPYHFGWYLAIVYSVMVWDAVPCINTVLFQQKLAGGYIFSF